MTLAELLRDARHQLEAAGIAADEAAVDADVLARHALGGWDRGHLLTRLRDHAPPDFPAAFARVVARRARREPAAYITGTREFWGLDMAVTRETLIPRPETEGLVEAVLARAPTGHITIADVCTGSGCIAVALARARPDARVVATDRSEPALAVATRNARAHRVAAQVSFVRTDLLDGLSGAFDVVAANPPYVPRGDAAAAQPEVRDYEPLLALDGGVDGLDLIRRLVPAAATRMAHGAWLAIEFGAGQSPSIRAIMAAERSITLVDVLDDLAGVPRVAVARKHGSIRT